jgi:hypothetical protein
VLLNHLGDINLWIQLGSPKQYSTSKFEASLSGLKNNILNSNNTPRWREMLLLRAIEGEILQYILDNDVVFDPTLVCCYKKIIFLGHGNFDIGYIDIARRNLLFETYNVRFRTRTSKGCDKFSIILYKLNSGEEQCGFIETIIVEKAGIGVHSGYFLLDDVFAKICISILKPNLQPKKILLTKGFVEKNV